MNFNEKFSNTQMDESIKGEAIKQGAKKAAKYTRVMSKKALKNSKKFLNKPVTKTRKGLLAATGAAFTAGRLSKRSKNESLIEKLDRVTESIKYTNEINLAGAGNAVKNAGKSVWNGTKSVAKNVGDTAKTVGGAIKKHPYRTAAGAAAIGTGYLGYKGAKKAMRGTAKGAKKAYQDWKI